MRNNDFDFIKDKFNKAQPDIPRCLDEDLLKYQILSKKEHKMVKFEQKKKISIKPIVSIAACFILVFGVLFSINPFNKNEAKAENFKSYDELNSVVSELEKWDNSQTGGSGSAFQNLYMEDDLNHKSAKAATDGNYIYYAYHDYCNDENKNKIYVFKATGEDTELVNIMNDVTPNDDYTISAVFICEKSLAAIITNSDETITKIYDISNPNNPTLIHEIVQDGMLLNSYMIDGVVYLASFYGVGQDSVDDFVPESENLKVEAKNIYRFENIKTANYMVVGAVDIKSGKRANDTIAVLGSYSNAYITDGYLYIANDNAFYTDNFDEIEYIKCDLKSGKVLFDKPERLNIPKADSIEMVFTKVSDNIIFSIGPSEDFVNEIVLYDISDKENPRILDRKQFDNVYGIAYDIQYKNGVYAFSADYADTERRYFGVVTFEIKDNKIEIKDTFANDDDNIMYQGECIMIDDYVYSFDQNDYATDNEKLTVYAYRY